LNEGAPAATSVRREVKLQAQKNLAEARFFNARDRLDNLNFLGLHALLAAGSDEGNLLTFLQALEAVALDGAEVYEEVVTGLRSDEAEAFLIVEPLNGTGLAIGHLMSP
jgi:hypothetical protein